MQQSAATRARVEAVKRRLMQPTVNATIYSADGVALSRRSGIPARYYDGAVFIDALTFHDVDGPRVSKLVIGVDDFVGCVSSAEIDVDFVPNGGDVTIQWDGPAIKLS